MVVLMRRGNQSNVACVAMAPDLSLKLGRRIMGVHHSQRAPSVAINDAELSGNRRANPIGYGTDMIDESRINGEGDRMPPLSVLPGTPAVPFAKEAEPAAVEEACVLASTEPEIGVVTSDLPHVASLRAVSGTMPADDRGIDMSVIKEGVETAGCVDSRERSRSRPSIDCLSSGEVSIDEELEPTSPKLVIAENKSFIIAAAPSLPLRTSGICTRPMTEAKTGGTLAAGAARCD